jgi:hypothetical protein
MALMLRPRARSFNPSHDGSSAQPPWCRRRLPVDPREQPLGDRADGGIGARRGSELEEDALDVRPDRPASDDQALGDLAVRAAPSDQREHVELARRQPVGQLDRGDARGRDAIGGAGVGDRDQLDAMPAAGRGLPPVERRRDDPIRHQPPQQLGGG